MSLIPGLGAIPESWGVRRGRFAVQYQQRPVLGNDGIVTAFRDGEVTLRSNRRTEGFTNAIQEIGYQGVEPGDLVVHSMDGFAGAIGVSAARGKMSPVVHIHRCADGDSRFMAYVLRSLAASNYVQALAKGIRERSTSFDRSTLADLDLPFPIAAEQWRIANFLDDQVSRIDEVIAFRHSQVDLAAEALDAFREERLVDVDGARRIPLQRLTDPTRPIVYGIVQAGEEVPDGVPYIKTGDMNPLRPDQLCRTSPEIDKAYSRARVRPGDIVIAMRGVGNLRWSNGGRTA